MENNKNNNIDMEEFECSRLSLCDLPLHDQELLHQLTSGTTTSLYHQENENPISKQDSFEFSTSPNSNTDLTANNHIIFCGKLIIHSTKEEEEEEEEEEPQKNSLFPLSSARLLNKSSRRSYSCHIQTPKPSPPPPPPHTGSFRYRAGSSRKHKALIGLARIPQKMELSDIKKRQSRRAPAPMFPSVVMAGDEELAAGDGGSGMKGQKGLVRQWKCTANFASALVKACSRCIPIV